MRNGSIVTTVSGTDVRASGCIPTPRRGRGSVAGFDVLTELQRDADVLAETIAAAITAEGGGDVFVASHPARSDGHRHIALSISASGVATPSSWWDVLSEAVDSNPGNGIGLALDDRYIGLPQLREPLADAVQAHRTRRSGRVIVFPGCTTNAGTVMVEELLATSAIDRVRVLAGGRADPGSLVRTRNFLRPRWDDGELVLDTQPAAGGALVPFETPFPTPCCQSQG